MDSKTLTPEQNTEQVSGFMERHASLLAYGSIGLIAGIGVGALLTEVGTEHSEAVPITATIALTVGSLSVAGALWNRAFNRHRGSSS